ncbi:MAG: N-acetyltransferase family protein [Dehalococcoidia bacterium]
MEKRKVLVRPASEADLPEINRIYNDEILTGVASCDEAAWTIEKRRAWFATHDERTPVLVAEVDGRFGGFAYLSLMSDKSGWRLTREDTIYLDPEFRGRGVGRVLLEALLEEARALRLQLVVASITTDNEASIELHRKLGFEVVGTLRQAGLKFGRRLDTCYMQLVLGES